MTFLCSSSNNPNEEQLSLSDSLDKYKTLIFVMRADSNTPLASTVVPKQVFMQSSRVYVAWYETSNWGASIMVWYVDETHVKVKISERHGWNTINLIAYGM